MNNYLFFASFCILCTTSLPETNASACFAPLPERQERLNALHNAIGAQRLLEDERWGDIAWLSETFAVTRACIFIEKLLGLPD